MSNESYGGGGFGFFAFSFMVFSAITFLVISSAYFFMGNGHKNENNTNEAVYFSKSKQSVVIQEEIKKLDDYLSVDSDYTLYDKKYSADMDGINELMDDQRTELKRILGDTFYAQYVETGSFKLKGVYDDGKTLRVLVSKGMGLEYTYTDKSDHEYDQSYMVENSEMRNLIRGLTYAFKDTRDIKVLYGDIERDKYNKKVFYPYGIEMSHLPNVYFFKRSELSKVVNWDDYPYENLLRLNKYKKRSIREL